MIHYLRHAKELRVEFAEKNNKKGKGAELFESQLTEGCWILPFVAYSAAGGTFIVHLVRSERAYCRVNQGVRLTRDKTSTTPFDTTPFDLPNLPI